MIGDISGAANFVGTLGDIDVEGETGLAAWGVTGGLVFVGYNTVPVMNNAGRVANRAHLAVSPTASWGFVTAVAGPGPGADFQVLQSENDSVPGVPGAKFLPFDGSHECCSIVDDGSVSFVGTYWDGPAYRNGLFKSDGQGTVSPVLLSGDPAPGLAANASIGSIHAHGMLSDGRFMVNTTVYYDADEWGGFSNKEGVFYVQEPAGTFTPVMRQGQPAPGIEGALLGEPVNSFAANDNGEVVISSTFYGISVPPNTNSAIWLYTPGKGLRLVVRLGSKFTIGPGDERTVSNARVSSTQSTVSLRASGRTSNINDAGQMAINLSFSEPNPTPGTLAASNSAMILAWFEDEANEPPAAVDDYYDAGEDTLLGIASPGVLANDTDDGSEPLTAVLNKAASAGDVTVYGGGSFNYTPWPGFVGQDSFEYKVCDIDNACDIGTVFIDVLQAGVCEDFSCNSETGCCIVEKTCNDLNPCTFDICNPESGCEHLQKQCEPLDLCSYASCDENTGCYEHGPIICSDNDMCTIDWCDPAVGCVFTPKDCNDLNECTLDYCENGMCLNVPKQCEPLNLCSYASCSPATGCYEYGAITCLDNDPCTVDSCNPAVGCVFTPKDCNDFNACTVDSCEGGMCLNMLKMCDDNNVCNGTEKCNPVTGCFSEGGLNCNDFSECTDDTCDPILGCQHQQVDCNDNDACTSDYCTVVEGCHHVAIECGDLNPCTITSCDSQVGCVASLIVGCCQSDLDCEPGVACVEGQCDEPEDDVVEQPDVVESDANGSDAIDEDSIPGDVTDEDLPQTDLNQGDGASDDGSGDSSTQADGRSDVFDIGPTDASHDGALPADTSPGDMATQDTTKDGYSSLDASQEKDGHAEDDLYSSDVPADGSSDATSEDPGGNKGGSSCSTSSGPQSTAALILLALTILVLAACRRRQEPEYGRGKWNPPSLRPWVELRRGKMWK